MKALLKYIIIVVLLVTQFSCNDWLELLPTNGLTRDEFWEKKEDVQAVLMAAYETFSSMDEKLFLYGELRGDLLEGQNNQSGAERNIMQGNIYSDNSFIDWNSFYIVINYCNEVIKNAPLVKKIDDTFTDYQLVSLVSEAYFLRSLSYFYLVRIYKEVPLVLEPSESDNVNFYLPKATEDEVLAQIVDDLKKNREYAPSGSFATIEENKGRASKAAFDALLADIELWRFNYEEVLVHTQKIEDQKTIMLMPGSRWFEIFYPGNSLESIFEFQFDANKGQQNRIYGLTARTSNRYRPSQKAIQMFSYETAFELVRGQDASIGKLGETEYVIWKYVGQAADSRTLRSGNNQNSANWIVYRYADVLLMKAEALAMLNRFDEALIIINQVRERANPISVTIANSKIAFEDAIMQERALELAFEGKRWFDLLRLGRRNDYARKDQLIEIIITNVPSTQKRIMAAKLSNPMGWYLPIKESEIDRNKNLEQNPFYEF